MEVAPGIDLLTSDLGTRSLTQVLLRGAERGALVDAGLAVTPDAETAPRLAALGVGDGDLDLLLVSHADVDHCGGLARMRERHPRAEVRAGAADRRWIEDPAVMLRENYLWYAEHGFGPDAATVAFIEEQLGAGAPVDGALDEGDVVDLGGLELEVLALPGHTPGHVGLWAAEHGVAIIVDAVLERGVRDRAGTLLIPPRIYDVGAYRATIDRVRALGAQTLVTAHFPVMRGAEVGAFLDRSVAFVDDVAATVAEAVGDGAATDLRDAWARADARLGPYPEFAIELAAAVRSELARQGADAAG